MSILRNKASQSRLFMRSISFSIPLFFICLISNTFSSDIQQRGQKKYSMNVFFNSTTDKLLLQNNRLRIYYKPIEQPFFVFEPVDNPPQITILFIHGLCEHSFRYFKPAVKWAHKGYQILLFDLQGHGSKLAQMKTILKWARNYLNEPYTDEFRNILKSFANEDSNLFEKIREQNVRELANVKMDVHFEQILSIIHTMGSSEEGMKQRPFFVAGHSLGGLLAANVGWHLGKSRKNLLDGVILFSPALMPIAEPSGGVLQSAVVKLSWHSRQNLLLTPLGWLIRSFSKLGLNQNTSWVSEWISDIQYERDLHRVDPLLLRRVPVSYLAEIEKLMSETINKGSDYPVDSIIFAPLADPVVNAKGTVRFGRELQTSRKTDSNPLVTYPEFPYHELLRSSKREEVFEEMYRWLMAHF